MLRDHFDFLFFITWMVELRLFYYSGIGLGEFLPSVTFAQIRRLEPPGTGWLSK